MKFRQGVLAFVAALLLGAFAAPAQGAVTVGQLPSPNPPSLCTNANPFDLLQPTVTSGNSFVVPSTIAAGRITSWSHEAGPGAGQTLALKTFRGTSNPAVFQVVAHDGPRALAPSVRNTFSGINLPVKAGDILGLNDGTVDNACLVSIAGEMHREKQGDLADGQSDTFNTSGGRLNVTATVEPTNTFTTGATARNKKKGTATVDVVVPNPGEVTVGGNGVKGAADASTAVAVTAPGTVKVTIRAKGKKKRKLKDKGKVKVNPTITYTPTGGTALSQTTQLKLRKKLKK